tara:strand:- start:764 stop:1345 length:582 start_codon:yes stop_codon:yes gene_type:complete
MKKTNTGQLRIVAGKWRSRLLQVANAPGLKPTAIRIRETLFNWLSPRIEGARCLDLCAGTGALGLEALSRGASRVVFVECSDIAFESLKFNINSLKASGAELRKTDAISFLNNSVIEKFDIIFIDPPYTDGLYDDLFELIAVKGWLSKNARIYIEMSANEKELDLPKNWHILKRKRTGNVYYLLVAASKIENF